MKKRILIRVSALVVIICAISMLGACSTGIYKKSIHWEEMIANNTKGYLLVDKGRYEEAIEYLEEAVEHAYEIEPALVDLDREIKLDEPMGAPFNNLSWAYNELEDYEKSLEYIEKSLLIVPNRDMEYVNKGNALYGLYRYEEALESYNQALELGDEKYAHYGKGRVLFDLERYEEALEQFDIYIGLDDTDMDGYEMKAYALLWLDRYEEANKLADGLIRKEPDNYDAYRIKAAVLKDLDDLDILAEHYNGMIDKFPDHMDVYVQMIESYTMLGDLDRAKNSYDAAVQKDKSFADIHIAMGDVYMEQSMYVQAAKYYDQAVQLNPQDEESMINKLRALYNGRRNYQCIAFGDEVMKRKVNSSLIPWFTGECHFDLDQYDEAIQAMEQVIELDPEDDEAYAMIAYSYFMMEDYDLAEEFCEKTLEIYSGNSTALRIQDAIRDSRKPLGERVKSFFKDNYLYISSVPDMDEILSALDKEHMTPAEIAKIIDRAQYKRDAFTSVIYGEEYDRLTAPYGQDVIYEDQGSIAYFRIHEFNHNTDDRFIEELNRIADPETKQLVIDLRGNTGGNMDSANHILDALLPECVTSMLIERDGYADSYYSDADYVSFKQIYILVDGYTASASELLTMGLGTYLPNVTIIGQDTYGKGVGQRVFEDKQNKLMILAVNHYWNVRQNNIMNSYISPDINVKGSALEEYMKPVKAGR